MSAKFPRGGATPFSAIRLIWLPYSTQWNMETIKRKINPQIKIRQIVKLNDKCNKSK